MATNAGFDFGTVLQLMGNISMLVEEISTINVGSTVQTPESTAVHVTLGDGKKFAVTLAATREA